MLGSHEAHELNELLLSCTNSIQSMGLFLEQAQDPELRNMISSHFSVHVQDYNMKVEFVSRSMSRDQLNVPQLNLNANMAVEPINVQPIQPEVKLMKLDDRAIATSYLLTLKRAGREYAWSAFETTTPQLRAFLEDAFRMCSHQSFEVWQFMARRGWYPVIQAPSSTIQTLQQTYQQVPYHQAPYQQPATQNVLQNGYQ
ncbi:Spore coat protein CotF [Paenibacillus sp. UNCCL117]|uniref:spore coat protein n=1 Tax=unclassified Paenibacillus TaxID=185978 RepID=UPI0008881DBE|nr:MULTISPECIES: spore coat protein [unclassified Paenibacillus]SDC95224.1 Spore coat protein CotF [Paenibacillus sp. cl123]SFW29979.1 Spore coat protein CotF [Paenibacillus sp. UNCCL117]